MKNEIENQYCIGELHARILSLTKENERLKHSLELTDHAHQLTAKQVASPSQAAERGKGYIVELERGCWMADGQGDPPRTTVKQNAYVFRTFYDAEVGRALARSYRPFLNATIEPAAPAPEPAGER